MSLAAGRWRKQCFHFTGYYQLLCYASCCKPGNGFLLESDRMLSLSFDPQVLEVQRKVVIEEFKQRYLNQPYGDVWLKLRTTSLSEASLPLGHHWQRHQPYRKRYFR
jgi:hypothetical protein